MLWQVRALLPDRPGAMASLAGRCGERGANILALDVHPTPDGRVVDELVIHSPSDWGLREVQQLCQEAGVEDSVVTESSARALEDQPVRYLRAAQVLLERPDRLEELLCRLLDAMPAESAASAALLIDDDAGPLVALSRSHPFTVTEEARATELRLVAAASGSRRAEGRDDVTPQTDAGLTLRLGTSADLRGVIAMHDRCSAESLSRRYRSPVSRVSVRLAESLLTPADGFSMVLTGADGRTVVGLGTVVFGPDVVEAAVLVEDRWQRRGHGTRLLHALAAEAASSGAAELTLLARRDNGSVLGVVHRAGLRAHVSVQDGLTRIRVPLAGLTTSTAAPGTPGPRRKPARLRATDGLVALLHERRELRDIYAPADVIDRSVRDGV